MHFNRVIVVLTLVLTLCIPMSICAYTEEVVVLDDGTHVVEERNVFEEFYYRLFLKDTKDFYDYIMLGVFIIGLLIVMIFQNTHYYTVKVTKKPEESIKKEEKVELVEPKYEKRNDYKPKRNNQKRKNYEKKKKLETSETSSQS